MEFTELHGLVIVKPTDICKGRNTRKDATIDYILCNGKKVLNTCQSMLVDERREVTQISDHNLISTTCRVGDSRGTGRTGARVKKNNEWVQSGEYCQSKYTPH